MVVWWVSAGGAMPSAAGCISCAQALPPTPMRVCMLARAVGEGAAVCAARARQCWRFYGPPAARGRARRKCWIIKLSARVRAGA